MGPGVRSTTTEPTAPRASARPPNGMPTSWATPSETDAAATPAIIRSFDGATAIGATVLAFPSTTANTLPCRRTADIAILPPTPRHGTGDLASRCTGTSRPPALPHRMLRACQWGWPPTNHNPGGSHLIGRGWCISHQRRAVGQGVSPVAGLLVADRAVDDDLARYPLAARPCADGKQPIGRLAGKTGGPRGQLVRQLLEVVHLVVVRHQDQRAVRVDVVGHRIARLSSCGCGSR